MNLIRRLFRIFDRRRDPRRQSRYGSEVLFAGWVQVPTAYGKVRRPG